MYACTLYVRVQNFTIYKRAQTVYQRINNAIYEKGFGAFDIELPKKDAGKNSINNKSQKLPYVLTYVAPDVRIYISIHVCATHVKGTLHKKMYADAKGVTGCGETDFTAWESDWEYCKETPCPLTLKADSSYEQDDARMDGKTVLTIYVDPAQYEDSGSDHLLIRTVDLELK